ncbi:hypothetical protein Taro_003173 [Colocasia esculenta]|uniref:Uncharacterized protein n=1 Tax=Colocasia esculenta TaxID=4460 RepID=A0A843TIL6_COLES|nr:hypothetical protein [Colocasia esculenta]
MAPKTPATRRSQRLEILGGMSEGGSQGEGSAPKTKSPPKEEAAAAAGEGVKENGSGRKKRVAEGKGTSPPVEETKVEDEVVVENEDEVEEEEVEEEPKALTKKVAGKSRGLAKPTKGAKGGRGADDEEDGICQFVGGVVLTRGGEAEMASSLVIFENWELPAGLEKHGLDMEEAFGISNRRRSPLVLKPTVAGKLKLHHGALTLWPDEGGGVRNPSSPHRDITRSHLLWAETQVMVSLVRLRSVRGRRS